MDIGENIWDLTKGNIVWFTPSISEGTGSFTEYINLDRRTDLSLAPRGMNIIESATYPFSIATAWTALVDCAGITPRPISNDDEGNNNNNHHQPSSIMGDLFKRTLGLIFELSSTLSPFLPKSLDQWLPIQLDEAKTPKRAIIHGASGMVGLIALQLLQYWGYQCYATTLTATRGSLDLLLEKQEKCNRAHIAASSSSSAAAAASPLPFLPFIILDTSVTDPFLLYLPPLVLYLYGVGGSDPFERGLKLLAHTGQFVTLRGALIKHTDEHGVVLGALQGGAEYLQAKTRAASEAHVNYSVAISKPQAKGMEYTRKLIEKGVIQRNLIPIQVWESLDAIPEAMQKAWRNPNNLMRSNIDMSLKSES